ncbi:hypothetical protein [Pannonibacter sp. P2PFMT1]|uniref:hypothetical protein n=1 Tax=Pannonibacter sp. P2PFMT1 TaxID=2003582 RepID=UPI0016463DBC|nr:hypothetical protein [Pannonibacter sp. P2PFMT1]
MRLSVDWDNIEDLRRFERQIHELNKRFPLAVARTINQVGRRARTRVERALVKQTGLNREVIKRALVQAETAAPGKLLYSLRARGGFVRLKYFSPRETRAGVVAKPFGQRRLYEGTFMKGGKFPNRKEAKALGGHVWARGSARHKIWQQRSGVRIPEQMITGASAEAFRIEAERVLPERIRKLVLKLLK